MVLMSADEGASFDPTADGVLLARGVARQIHSVDDDVPLDTHFLGGDCD